jgi:hypothetical protein
MLRPSLSQRVTKKIPVVIESDRLRPVQGLTEWLGVVGARRDDAVNVAFILEKPV